MLIDCGIALKEIPLTLGTEAVSIYFIPCNHCTSHYRKLCKLQDWPIREAEETLKNNIRGPQEQCNHCTSHYRKLCKLQDWLIREAEETLKNNIRGPQER